MGELSAQGRKHVKDDNFALPGKRYPIHDREHAAAALARVAQHGSPEEKAAVRKAVCAKYPDFGICKSMKVADKMTGKKK
jgi:hypothetical protein